MFQRILRALKTITIAISIVLAVLPTLLSPEMRAVYATVASVR